MRVPLLNFGTTRFEITTVNRGIWRKGGGEGEPYDQVEFIGGSEVTHKGVRNSSGFVGCYNVVAGHVLSSFFLLLSNLGVLLATNNKNCCPPTGM